MSMWARVLLGEVVTIERKAVDPAEVGADTLYVGLENIARGGAFIKLRSAGEANLASAKFRFTADHVLYGKLRPNLAKIARPDFAGVCSTDILPLLPSKQLDRGYLAHFLAQPKVVELAASRATGANLPRLSPAELAKFVLPLPPPDEQQRISEVLDRADELRANRREAFAHLNELPRSIFLEMFGDPVSNRLRWPIKRLAEFGLLERGVSTHRPRNDPCLLDGPYPLVQTGDVANSGGYISDYKSTYSEIGLRQSRLWPQGTLCITIAANIAKTGILTFDACFPDSVVGFTASQPITLYIQTWLSFLQKSLEQLAPESAQKNINLAILRELPVISPPSELLDQFARRVSAVEALKVTQRASLAELDALFASLQDRAFRGLL